MNSIETGTIILSCSALIISIVAFLSNKRYTEISLRQVLRSNYMSKLFDLDKQFMNYPQLWAIYDNHSTGITKIDTPEEKGRRLALIYYQFNLFESLYNSYNVGLRLNKVDKEFWESWKKYITEFFKESSEARKLFKKDRCQEIYANGFVRFVNDIIHDIHN